MQEYITPAIILSRETRGEYDERVRFFSRQFGKMTARTVSSKKILSKLSPHIEPGNLVVLRLVEKNDLSLVDALKERSLPWQLANIMHLDSLLGDYGPDIELWHTLLDAPSWKKVLRVLGWDPEEASCDMCRESSVHYFETRNQRFFCKSCYASMSEQATIIRIA